ncbi:MAG: permease [Deltaproteobacteria bacterium]|nr:permease [Deltaproteobacteria bacterium]MBW2306809.1 permease [Deltaproteobacteria bacterium]
MEPIQTITTLIFLVTIGLVIVRWIDSVVAAMLGVITMVVAGSMTEVQAFQFVDWNVIAILVSIWLIAGYFGKTGIPQYLADMTLRISRGNIPLFITLIGTLSGFVSMFIDNVVVVLMIAPIIFHIRKLYHFEGTGPILFIGLCSNFMGTALLLGDLPPQMLHSVSGVEFLGFIWQFGRPSSFIILTMTYLVVVLFFYFKFSRSSLAQCVIDPKAAHVAVQEPMEHIQNKRFAFIVCAVFLLTIIGMSLRQVLGVKLGFIAFSGALLLVLIFELFKNSFRLDPPSLEEMLAELDWKAIGFYVSLFALVGGLEHAHILKIVADWLVPYIQSSLLLGVSILYWVTAPIVGIVEHDAYILTLLYVIRDLAQTHNIDPWPLYWGLVWAGTLGSNLTIAGAPALYVALTMGEREDGRKWSLREFLGYSVPYVIISLVVCYILMILIWVLPFM